MVSIKVGGIDPGPKPGLVVLHIDGRLQRLLRVERGEHLTPEHVVEVSDFVAVERYVRGRASVRSHDSGAQLLTQRMAQEVCAMCSRQGVTFQALPAGSVKPWATDERLKAYTVEVGHTINSLYTETKGGGGHDRDAARHALSLAVKLGLLPRL